MREECAGQSHGNGEINSILHVRPSELIHCPTNTGEVKGGSIGGEAAIAELLQGEGKVGGVPFLRPHGHLAFLLNR